MASADKCYPDYLNPFGSDEEADGGEEQDNKCPIMKPVDEYPDYLSPFDDIEEQEAGHTSTANRIKLERDYDDSLNPFCDDNDVDHLQSKQLASQQANKALTQQAPEDKDEDLGEGNPFAEDVEEEVKQTPLTAATTTDQQLLPSIETETSKNDTTSKAIATKAPATSPHQEQETLDKPPVPLPRTKSLLKKELRLKQLQQQQLIKAELPNHATRSSQLADKNDSLPEER